MQAEEPLYAACFNGAGVLADSCVCARCHGFQLKDSGLGKDEVLPRFHPTADVALRVSTCTFPSRNALFAVVGAVFRWLIQLIPGAPAPVMDQSFQ